MTTGNLKDKVVSGNFWPKCANCKFHQECLVEPKHKAFPHSWHWGWNGQEFSDDSKAIDASWVGTAAIGEDHTGCYSYQVEDVYLLEPSKNHLRYFDIKKQLNDMWDELFKEMQELTK